MKERRRYICTWLLNESITIYQGKVSDYIVKIIPEKISLCMGAEEIRRIKNWLEQTFVSSNITYRTSETPQFVDCGSNLENIICPVCNNTVSLDWWSETMDASYVYDRFKTLVVKTPCCQNDISLNDFDYYGRCGFSCIEFDIYNPAIDVNDTFVKRFEMQTGVEVRILKCHL